MIFILLPLGNLPTSKEFESGRSLSTAFDSCKTVPTWMFNTSLLISKSADKSLLCMYPSTDRYSSLIRTKE